MLWKTFNLVVSINEIQWVWTYINTILVIFVKAPALTPWSSSRILETLREPLRLFVSREIE